MIFTSKEPAGPEASVGERVILWDAEGSMGDVPQQIDAGKIIRFDRQPRAGFFRPARLLAVCVSDARNGRFEVPVR